MDKTYSIYIYVENSLFMHTKWYLIEIAQSELDNLFALPSSCP